MSYNPYDGAQGVPPPVGTSDNLLPLPPMASGGLFLAY
jgi:hypothetical protein